MNPNPDFFLPKPNQTSRTVKQQDKNILTAHDNLAQKRSTCNISMVRSYVQYQHFCLGNRRKATDFPSNFPLTLNLAANWCLRGSTQAKRQHPRPRSDPDFCPSCFISPTFIWLNVLDSDGFIVFYSVLMAPSGVLKRSQAPPRPC